MTTSLTTGMADHLWQSTLFAAIAWLLALALRRNRARARHAVWLAASVKFLIPLSVLMWAGSQVEWRKSTATAEPSNFTIVMDQVSEPFTAALPPVAVAAPVQSVSRLPEVLLGIWGCGCLGIAAAWLIRWQRIRKAFHNASAVTFTTPIRALTSPTLLEPGVFGIFRPVLLLPEGIADRLSPEQLQTVIEHELCHVRHHDNLVAAIQMLVETVFWFHPLVWWIGRKMVEERERACDETVLLDGSDPQIYAEAILNVCKLYVESPLACVAGITGAGLKHRIEAIVASRTGRQLNRTQRALLAMAAAMTVLLPVAIGVMNARPMLAQEPQPQESQPKAVPKWEAVSIKPCEGGEPQGRSGGNAKGGGTARGPGRLTIPCQTPIRLIEQAYVAFANGRSPRFAQEPIEGAPAWTSNERYTIIAKAETPEGRIMMSGPMMQKMLEERFKLKIRRETREIPVYNLTVAKGGPKNLKVSKPDGCMPVTFDGPPPARDDKLCEMIERGVLKGEAQGKFLGYGFTMFAFADQLGALVDRKVIDKTGIAGKYDFTVPIPLEDLTPPVNDRDRPFENYRDDEMVMTGVKQLGLRLEPAKGPGTVWVIESIERPTDNFTPPAQAPQAPPVAAKPQRAPAPVVDKPLRFDAASLKPRNPVGGRGTMAVPRASRGAGRLQFSTGLSTVRLAGVVINTLTLIKEAYGIKDYQLVGQPGWVQSDRFDFEGKAEDAATYAQLRQMLQTFLAERFGLMMHRETRDTAVLAMTAGKDGIKAPLADAPEPPGLQAAQDQYAKHMIVTGTPELLADLLSGVPLNDIPVIDKTGLSGRYKFLAGWDEDDDFLPSVARQFGLKFEKQKASIDVLVVDRIQKPEAN